jgi:hypothetical protein
MTRTNEPPGGPDDPAGRRRRVGWIPRRRPNPGRDGRIPRPRPSIEDLGAEPFPTADHVLLCCFGVNWDPPATLAGWQLRLALVDAGFGAATARHLVRTSPLVGHIGRGRYRLREFDGAEVG